MPAFVEGGTQAVMATTIIGNFIGTDPTGAIAVGNVFAGVAIEASSGNTVGGATTPAAIRSPQQGERHRHRANEFHEQPGPRQFSSESI